MDSTELGYVYELGSDFRVLPTYGVMPQSNAMLAAAKTGGLKLPGMNFGFDRLLHGEQYTEIKRPLPPQAKLRHVFKFKEAFDKAPNAVVTFAVHSYDETGEEIIYNEMTSFVKGAGGWGGNRGPSADINVPPAREPDAVIEEKTDDNQTLLYRLSGDWNPLHADPAFAKAFGYEKPILHGMCTFGYCGRHVVKAFSGNDPRYFKSIKVRFAKSVFPGETLVTKMWKESDTRIIFETSVKERGEVVIKNAAVELYAEIPAPKAKAKAEPAAAKAAASGVDEGVTLADVFGGIKAFVAAKPALVAEVRAGQERGFELSDRMREQWGHPGWFPDSRHLIVASNTRIDTTAGGPAVKIPDLLHQGGDHPSVSPDGKLFVKDGPLANIGGAPGEWGVTVCDIRGRSFQILHRFQNEAGAKSWRKNHPHPIFSADGKRIYFNVNEGPWTQLLVAEIGGAQ